MAECGVAHPFYDRCVCRLEGGHASHGAYAAEVGGSVLWDNEDYQAPHRAWERLAFVNERVRESKQAHDVSARPPIVGNADPWESYEAAQRIEPGRGTRKRAVLNLLLANPGCWIDGTAIASPEVGGSEGLRRVRELRKADGWPIERRPSPHSSTSWQYRLPEGFVR